MDRRIGGRPPTHLSTARRSSRSPSPPSVRRHGSYSPSVVSGDDSDAVGRDRRLPQRPPSPPRRLTAQEASYLALQAERQRQHANAILIDDTPYVPPPNQNTRAASNHPPRQTFGRSQRRASGDHSRDHAYTYNQDYQHHANAQSRYIPNNYPREESSEESSSGSDDSGSSVDDPMSGGPRGGAGGAERRESGGHVSGGRAQHDPVPIPGDDTPFTTPSSSVDFNRERYPAYDENHRRIGMDHVRYVKPQLQQAPTNVHTPPANPQATTNTKKGHYHPRTHKYPADDEGATQVVAMSVDVPDGRSNRRALRTPPPLAPDDPEEMALISNDSASALRAHGRRRSPRRTAIVADPADIPDSTPHVRAMLGLKPDQEVNLHALLDPQPGEKPSYPYPILIQLAILGSPRKRLTLAEIYSAIEDRFEWFKNTNDKAWQGSIRHTLSLKSIFRSVSRPITEPGKGNYWMVDYTQGEGNKRVRKRNPRKKQETQQQANAMRQEDEESSGSESEPDATPIDETNIDPSLRSRGHAAGNRGAPMSNRGSDRGPHPPYGYPPQGMQGARGKANVAVPYSPQMVGNGSHASARPAPPQPAFGQPSMPGRPIYSQPPGHFGQPPNGPQPAFGQPSLVTGPPGGRAPPPSRGLYSPASSASSPPMSSVSPSSRQSPVFSDGSQHTVGYGRPPVHHPPPRQQPQQPQASGSNPFGLRHVGRTSGAWTRGARGRPMEEESGSDGSSD